MATNTKTAAQVLSVTVRRVRFTNDGFSIYDADSGEGRFTSFTVKQQAGPVVRDQRWVVAGKEIKDPKWGTQFACSYATLAQPTTLRELELFLTSGLVEGCGWREYARILDVVGPEPAIAATNGLVQGITSIEGITDHQVAALADMWSRGSTLAQVYVDLAEWGVAGRTADSLVKHYGAQCGKKLTENPYRDLLDIPYYGWKTAEQIASWVGILPADERRVRAGIELGVHNASWLQGHTWLTPHQAAMEGMKLLGMSHAQVEPEIDAAVEQGHITREGDRLYPTKLLHAEQAIVGEIAGRLIRPGLVNVQRTEGMFVGTQLGWKQIEAVLKGLTEPISLLTGGPGTGKTTCLKTLVEVALKLGLQVTCMAPTGKAAARLSEATGHPASTIHSKLRLLPGDDGSDSTGEQLAGLVIVDEVSMLDTQLCAAMFARISLGAQIVLVGDPDQLPSVGPGAVLRDILSADLIPHTHLDHVYRNEAGIAVNAKRLRDGEPLLDLPDCQIMPVDSQEQAQQHVAYMLNFLLSEGVTPDDILILTPTNEGATGRIQLNALLQGLMNPAPAGSGITQYVGTAGDQDGTIGKRQEEIRQGDRVMVTRNNTQLGVFNGQVGRVTGLEGQRTILVDIDGKEIAFTGEDRRSLTLAYAITGHKAQGSEAPIVLCPVFPSKVLSREWLYTVLTRAKKMAYFIGDRSALDACVSIRKAQERRTGLAYRLQMDAYTLAEQMRGE